MNESSKAPNETSQRYALSRLSLRQLRVIAAVAQTGGLQSAAFVLKVTQPAVSKALAEVERGLGYSLFVRSGRSLRTTSIGQQLVDMARRIDTELERGSQLLAAQARGEIGELRVGSTNVALPDLLPRAVARIKVELPHLTVSVTTYAMTAMLEALKSARLDLLLTRTTPVGLPTEIGVEPLGDVHEVLALSCLHPRASQRDWDWQALYDEQWIAPEPGIFARRQFDQFWQARGLATPPCLTTTNDALFALTLMRQLPAFCFLSRPMAEFAARQGLVVILPMPASLGLAPLSVWYRRQALSPVAVRLMALLREESRQGAGWV